MTTQWTFTDTVTFETGILGFNPTVANDPVLAKNNTFAQVLGTTSNPTLFYSQDIQGTGEINGSIFTEGDLNFFNYWFGHTNPIQITDDLGRSTVVLFQTFQPTRVRKAANKFYHEFKLTFQITSMLDF